MSLCSPYSGQESNLYGNADATEYDGEVQQQPWVEEEDVEEEEEEEDGELSSVYDFVESQGNRNSPTRILVLLDDDDDEQDIVEDECHAQVLYTNGEVRAKWMESLERLQHNLEDGGSRGASEDEEGEGGNKNPWDPFKMKAEWRFASWAIQEGIKLSFIDRFLDIPGFREKLELSYHNTRALLQHVDSLPERAEWQECMITIKDHPKEQHLLQFCDIIQAIHALLGNIRHTGKIMY
ncbi:hypothetical protein C8Q72DRAFT_797673 [Fomitopsis betulina]|nr:hypothetical protein C8Q72DRAFT_797673 [Fomitopsis betulina]